MASSFSHGIFWMTEINKIGPCARSNQVCLATVLLLAALAVESHSSECGPDSFASGSSSRSLLQVHPAKAWTGWLQTKASALCVVQGNDCFDIELDPERNAEVPQQQPPGPEKVQLVITRYSEDLRWLDVLPQVTAVVYNRGDQDSLLPASRSNLVVTQQENRGREDEVMLNHIISNYDNLPDVTVFLQAFPFEHCPGSIKAVRTAIATLIGSQNATVELSQQSAGAIEGLMPISAQFWQYDVAAGKLGLAERMLDDYHYPNPREAARDLYNKTCMEVLGGQPCPSLQWVAEGAQWAVSRERILSTPKHVYEGALKMGESWQSKYRGLVLEALWPTLWGASGWYPTNVRDIPQAFDAHKRARASDGYCASESGNLNAMYSCESRMEFCERKRHEGRQRSKQFEIERKRFQVHDESPEEPWYMIVEMEPVLWGSAIWKPDAGEASSAVYLPKLIEVDGSLHLEQNGTDSPRHVVTFRMTASKEGFALARQSSSGNWLYLGCDGNHSKLVNQEVGWAFQEISDGWVALRSTKDDLWLTLTQNQDGARLHCLPALEPVSIQTCQDKTFLFNLLMRPTEESSSHA